MGILDSIKNRFFVNRQDSIIFEVTQPCNNDCLFCYNVWKCRDDYPKGELPTEDTKKLIVKAIRDAKCRQFTFTGGEPLLRKDLPELVSFAKGLGVNVTIISNGTLFTEQSAKDYIKRGVGIFELPLLSADRKIHNELSRNPKAFDLVTESVANIKLHGGIVVAVFVGTKKNIDGFGEMIELAVALGADGIMFNRVNIGGEGTRHIAELLPAPQQVERALETAEAAMEKYKIGISCAIPIQPCVLDTGRFKKLHFGYCAAGSNRAYYTVDPLGNVRMCNHTPSILGNILENSFTALSRRDKVKYFTKPRPAFCRNCEMETVCQGGCKAAAEACTGSLCAEEPFLSAFKKAPVSKNSGKYRADGSAIYAD